MTSRIVLVLRPTGQLAGKRCRSAFALACWIGLGLGLGFSTAPQARAGFIFDFAPQNAFQLINTNADGFLIPQSNGFVLVGGNNGSLEPGTTDYVANATSSGIVNFDWSYSSQDLPTFDFAGYLLNGNFSPLADTDGQSGIGTFSVSTGESFGFRVGTADNQGEPGVLTVTGVNSATSAVPEPGTAPILLLLMGITLAVRCRRFRRYVKLGAGLLAGSALFAQIPINYSGTNVTGQLVLTGTVNLSQQARVLRSQVVGGPEVKPKIPPQLLPPPAPPRTLAAQAIAPMQSLPINPASGSFGFSGLTHLDQRNANSGNQFSVEPPNPSLAVGNGFILEGVNNAVQVYSSSGTPLLPAVLASNQVFGVPAAINRTTGVQGVYPTDMRVFYDQGINRWFVVQRAQAYDSAGNPQPKSQIYIAVSQTGDPTGAYNVYFIDTTDAQRAGCPCIADYLQIGADQSGFYISSNAFPAYSPYAIGATILAISKTSLASGASSPTTYKFVPPLPPDTSGFEFAIQPATTPPGASYAVGYGGLEYFVSSIANSDGDSYLSVWAMTNTSSLATSSPNLALTRIIVPTLLYSDPPSSSQRPGPLPYGSTLSPPGLEALIGASFGASYNDCRVLSVAYTGGRLYATFATLVSDENGNSLAGAAYVVFSPTFRGVLAATVLRQGYLLVKNNNLLYPAIAVNPQGWGAIAFTLVGPDYYPSAAFVTIDARLLALGSFATGSAVQLVALGAMPEDGFTGYPNAGFTEQGAARWGDYSTAVASGDGSIWMVTEYIPNAPRTPLANWGTFLTQVHAIIGGN